MELKQRSFHSAVNFVTMNYNDKLGVKKRKKDDFYFYINYPAALSAAECMCYSISK